MASLPSFTQFCTFPRWHMNPSSFSSRKFVQFPDVRLCSGFVLAAVSKKKLVAESSDGEEIESETKTKRTRGRRKKVLSEVPEETPSLEISGNDTNEEKVLASKSFEAATKPQRRTRKKVASTSSSLEDKPEKKVTRRRGRAKKKPDDTKDEGSEPELSEREDEDGDNTENDNDNDNEKDLEFDIDYEDDISFTYVWPPLICCFGYAQHAFVPSGRRANRLIDHESHERLKDALWDPEKFVRAPGGCVGNVALCIARLGGNAALMGKLGEDDFGKALLYHLNVNRVQTRAVRIDGKRATAVSRMRMSKRGGLRMTCVKPCAEDSLSKSEINIDVLKEAKMFYFNSFSLLDRKMRSSTLQALKISKKLGAVVFFDLNLPLPLWHSREETKTLIQEALELADIIEITKQELEFLLGIEPFERFDTKDNDWLKFVHFDQEIVAPIVHDNLKVLFVTNGTSKIHYYTKEHNGAVLGMEDAPVTPYTSDMSAAGDAVVAALMTKLVVQPHLMTDKGYLEHIIKYAINRGVTEQWLQARTLGYPPKEDMEEDENDDLVPDPNGLKSITEKEYRTLGKVTSSSSLELQAMEN